MCYECSGYIPYTKSALEVIFFAYRLLLERVKVGAAYSKCHNDLLCIRESLVWCYLVLNGVYYIQDHAQSVQLDMHTTVIETYAVEVYPTYFATTGPLGIADHIQNRVTTSPFHSLKTIMSDYTGRYSLSTAQSLSINYSHTIYFP
ncbi:hypothetical protein BDB01DRAFT_831536 [Pilobolus umbonatus]|nr:hypothetical protein BDB01DRAFT_831536 [Pilobolus umbonatus]